jgi:hypothetical protein
MRLLSRHYGEFCSVMVGFMYLDAPQGRVGGIKNLLYEEIESMLTDGFGFSTTFKTASIFGYQPVIIPLRIKEMFMYYIKTLRKKILAMNQLDNNDYVFINYRGEKYESLDKGISSWFRRHEFNVTTNVIRSLADTQTHELRTHGRILPALEESIFEINGHSGETSKDYYRRSSFKAHVSNGNQVFDIIRTEAMPEKSIFGLQADTIPKIDFGVEHPQYQKPEAKRIVWSPAEHAYLLQIFKAKEIKESNKPYILALQKIRNDPAAQRIFHTHHVFSQSRIRDGYRCLLQKIKNQAVDDENLLI